MGTTEVLQKLKVLKKDFTDKNIDSDAVIITLSLLADKSNLFFSDLLAAFYSSEPERFIK